MEAEFLGEDEEDIGVSVIDNSGASHHIEMNKSNGNLYAHHCDEYADKPEDRTLEENEYNEQARRFAQYYVYQERGYDTVPSRIHPERINAVRLAVAEMDLEEFEEYFGDLYQQLKSHHDDSYDPVIQPPADAQSEDLVLYRTNVYLGLDPLE
ncbi:hypothetical protein G6M89_22070, partial [Natronolimnobius sp. AArcel1]|nr:hypothetical protein [Natronolimnobius sp. AArcel1]